MFEQLYSEIQSLKNDLEYTRNFLKEAKRYRRRVEAAISAVESTLSSAYNKDFMSEIIAKSAKAQVDIELGEEILKEEILVAVRKNREYSYHLYLNALMRVVESGNIFSTIIFGSGWNRSLHVDINFSRVAGNLSDWAEGVVRTREELRVSKGPNAERSSKIWRTKIYRKAPYSKTILMRIGFSGKPAAFWELLDKGTVSLESDRGGTPYPHYYRPTNFVDKAAHRMKKEFRRIFREGKEKFRSDLNDLLAVKESLSGALSDLDSIVSSISTEISKNKRVYAKFDAVKKYVDSEKLDRVLYSIRHGTRVETARSGRVEITRAGSPKRIRPSLASLQVLMESD